MIRKNGNDASGSRSSQPRLLNDEVPFLTILRNAGRFIANKDLMI
jgi:hypothetical protein